MKDEDLLPFDPFEQKQTPKLCAKCGSTKIMLVQYGRGLGTGPEMHPCHLDGWSEIACSDCGARIGAWSGRTLVGYDHEPPYGGTHNADCPFAGRMTGLPTVPPLLLS